MYEDGLITEAACMAYARRKIHDVHARTTEALKRIGKLYAIEAEITRQPGRGMAVSPERENYPADAVTLRLDTGANEGAVAALGYGENLRLPA